MVTAAAARVKEADAAARVAAKEKHITDVIAATIGEAGNWNSQVVSEMRYITGWAVHRMLCALERQRYDPDAVAPANDGNWTEDKQVRVLLQSLDTSAGRNQGSRLQLGPGMCLVRAPTILVTFMLLLEKRLQLQVLHPAMILHHKQNIMTHTLETIRESRSVDKRWSALVGVLNSGREKTPQIGPRAGRRVLQLLVEQYLLSKQKTLRVGHGLIPDSQRQLKLRSAGKVAAASSERSALRILSSYSDIPVPALRAAVLAQQLTEAENTKQTEVARKMRVQSYEKGKTV